MSTYASGFEWRRDTVFVSSVPGTDTWKLYSPAGKHCADVWVRDDSATWAVWDEQGIGGENDTERGTDRKRLLRLACDMAEAALFRAGWHVRPKLKRGKKKAADESARARKGGVTT